MDDDEPVLVDDDSIIVEGEFKREPEEKYVNGQREAEPCSICLAPQ